MTTTTNSNGGVKVWLDNIRTHPIAHVLSLVVFAHLLYQVKPAIVIMVMLPGALIMQGIIEWGVQRELRQQGKEVIPSAELIAKARILLVYDIASAIFAAYLAFHIHRNPSESLLHLLALSSTLFAGVGCICNAAVLWGVFYRPSTVITEEIIFQQRQMYIVQSPRMQRYIWLMAAIMVASTVGFTFWHPEIFFG